MGEAEEGGVAKRSRGFLEEYEESRNKCCLGNRTVGGRQLSETTSETGDGKWRSCWASAIIAVAGFLRARGYCSNEEASSSSWVRLYLGGGINLNLHPAP